MLLYALRHHYAVSFSYRGQLFLALPLKIIINRYEGRQYLQAMVKSSASGSQYGQHQTFRVDTMQNLQLAGKAQTRAGCAPPPRHELKITFHACTPEDDERIRRRILKRMPEAEISQDPEHSLHCRLQVQDDLSLLPWLRTFYPHLCPKGISSKILRERMLEDLKEMFANYGLCPPLP